MLGRKKSPPQVSYLFWKGLDEYIQKSLVQKYFTQLILIKLHFCAFLVDFHSALLFFAYYGFILRFWGNFLGSAGVGDEHGSILIFYTFCVFALFCIFCHFLALFWF